MFQFVRQYARSKYLEILQCHLLVDPVHEGQCEELPEIESVLCWGSPIVKAGQKLSVEEVKLYIRRHCPSARIDVREVNYLQLLMCLITT